jgi:tRNA(Ile)-lysidine synthase
VVDHGWSEAASAASAVAASTCRHLGLDPVELLPVDSGGPGGPEAAARTARYAALEASARRQQARAVLLGHTLDDQAETVLLGLARGSGARSLAGMAARRGLHRRPLLGLTRQVTLAACAELGLTPWHDPANEDPAYARVRVRRLAADLEGALGPGVVRALARSADLLRDDADALDAAARELLAAAGTAPGGGPAIGVLVGAPVAVRRRALLAAARRAGSPSGSLGHRHALALDALLTDGGSADLPGGVVARIGLDEDGVRRLRFGRRSDVAPGYGKLDPVAGGSPQARVTQPTRRTT